ncbi:MAG TPA: carbonic anhydrase [Reyranella sp.]|jgi:carbonic anhydrase|nr:carbonic anhydrase [Reyranella sp.]
MALERLLKGFRDFRLGYYREHLDLFEKLATEGQSPKILIIGCADARVDPGILTQTQPGDIFTVRNIGAIVPPAQIPPDTRQHGTSAAIEFAVRGLEVEHIVILGHALCGGIAALVDGDKSAFADYDYLSTWTAVAQDVRELALREMAGRPRTEIVRAVEQASVVNSVLNLMGFPWIAERVAAGKLVLHAWWFNLTEGQLYAFNPSTSRFDAVTGLEVRPTIDKSTTFAGVRPEHLIATFAKKPAF